MSFQGIDSPLKTSENNSMTQEKSVAEKALSLNLNRPLYGSIAEIGAGQEVARWFFKVGGAAGTIAKAMSAYDMTFSDDIYGKEASGRYVVESRLRKMLDHEYSLLETRLSDQDQKEKYFFAFADTVAAKSFKYDGICHGWMGVKFQQNPDQEPSQVILHVRMLDNTNLQQQEALGTLGINLTYACYNHSDNIEKFLSSLVDGEIKSRVEITLVRFEGILFKDVDPIKANLTLLEKGLADSILIPFDSDVAYLGEALYNKQVIIHRGSFHPPLLTDFDILKSARDHYCGSKTEGLCDPYLINELYFDKEKNNIDEILDSVNKLRCCKQNVLISSFERAYQLSEYVAQFTSNHINFVYRANRLVNILEAERLVSLERLARIFNENTRIYIYPTPSSQIDKSFLKDPKKELFEMSDYKASDKNKLLFEHLVLSGYLIELTNFNPEYAMWTETIFKDCQSNNTNNWEKIVPKEISGS